MSPYNGFAQIHISAENVFIIVGIAIRRVCLLIGSFVP